MNEVEAIKRYLAVLCARAVIHADRLPWWDFRGRARGRWSAAAAATTALAIERGEHLAEQGQSVSVIEESHAREGV